MKRVSEKTTKNMSTNDVNFIIIHRRRREERKRKKNTEREREKRKAIFDFFLSLEKVKKTS
jgi:hypothetical protein